MLSKGLLYKKDYKPLESPCGNPKTQQNLPSIQPLSRKKTLRTPTWKNLSTSDSLSTMGLIQEKNLTSAPAVGKAPFFDLYEH